MRLITIAVAAILLAASCSPFLPYRESGAMDLRLRFPLADAPSKGAKFIVPGMEEIRLSVVSADPSVPFERFMALPVVADESGFPTAQARIEAVPIGIPLTIGVEGILGGLAVSASTSICTLASDTAPVSLSMRPTPLFAPDATFGAPSQVPASPGISGIDAFGGKSIRVDVASSDVGKPFALDFDLALPSATGIRVRFEDGSKVPYSFSADRARIAFTPIASGSHYVLLFNPTDAVAATGDVYCRLDRAVAAPSPLSKTQGDPAFSIARAPLDGLSWAYESSSPAVVSVDASGNAFVSGPGTATLAAILPPGGQYADVRLDIPVTVAAAKVRLFGAGSIRSTQAVLSGALIDAIEAVELGVCYSTAPSPTVANQIATTAPAAGTFELSLASLSTGTRYYARPYVKKSSGDVFYGDEISFRPVYAVGDAYAGGIIWQISGEWPNQYGKVYMPGLTIALEWGHDPLYAPTNALSDNDGSANTRLIVDFLGSKGIDPATYAAGYCDTLTTGGAGWYLPAPNELLALFAAIPDPDASYVNGYYTSMEAGNSYAYKIIYPLTQQAPTKNFAFRFIPMKAFALAP
jgi:hypothetical protein